MMYWNCRFAFIMFIKVNRYFFCTNDMIYKLIKKSVLVLIVLAYIISLGQFTLNWARKSGRGGMPGAFMSWGAGARSLGMGKAFVALADDASATYWNPAGLADLHRSELTALHSVLWGGSVYDFVSYVQPTEFGGTFGFSGTRLFMGGFEGRDAKNRVTHTFEDIQSAYGLSYGQRILEELAVGGTFKKMSHTLDNHKSGSYILDIGGIYTPIEDLRVGLNMQNLLSESYNTSDELPIMARLGVNYKLLRDRLSLGADISTAIGWDSGLPYNIGMEFWALDYLALRMGIDPQELNLGFGIEYDDYGVDYAYAAHDLGGSHRLSATISFGRSVKEIKERSAREYKTEGDVAYREGLYDDALKSFEKAYSLNPFDREVSRKRDILSDIAEWIPRKVEDTRSGSLLRRGIREYIENDNVDIIVLALNHIITEDPTDEQAKELLRWIGEKENLADPRIRVVSGMSLAEYKLHKGLQHFYNEDYAQAIEEYQEVLVIEPENAQAYKRIGSSFYSIGNEERAVEAWERSLQLNPADDDLRNFINQVRRPVDRDSEEFEIEDLME